MAQLPIQNFRFAFTATNPTYNREIITLAKAAKPAKEIVTANFREYKALWDTGATNSVVTHKVVEELGLIPAGIVKNRHAGGISEVSVYYIDLLLPNNITIPQVRVSECADQAGRFDIIVGMDIISLGDFAITGQGERRMVSFCMPSTLVVDYVSIANTINAQIQKQNTDDKP